MSDLISRQDAIAYLMTNMAWYNEDGYEESEDEKLNAITDLINGVPSAEPERKKGNEKCSNKLPCGWCSLFDTPCFGRGDEQDG